MFNFLKWGTHLEEEEFDNRILNKCKIEFRPEFPKPYLRHFNRLEKVGRGN